MKTHDVIVLGGGPGGYPAAVRCAQQGKKVCIVERDELGGVCLNRGCIPTKALVHRAREIETKTGGITKTVSFSWPEILANIKKDVVLRLRTGVGFLMKQYGITVVKEQGTLREPGIVETPAGTLSADNVIIATGSSPCIPTVFRDDPRVMTSDDLWRLESLPASIAIIGGGVIGCEFACIFHAMGVAVTIYEMMECLVPGADEELGKLLKNGLIKKGIRVNTGQCIGSCGEIPEEKILLSIGRTAATEAVADAGIAMEKRGIITDEFLRTNLPGVYAVGDVNGKAPYAYVATREGETAASVIGGAQRPMDYEDIPAAIFTTPEMGLCGMTEQQARAQSVPHRVGRFPYQALGRAHAEGATAGLFKVIAEEGSGRILGIHVIGERATEIVAFSTLAVKQRMTIADVERVLFCHPTFAEGIMEATADIDGSCVHLPPRKK